MHFASSSSDQQELSRQLRDTRSARSRVERRRYIMTIDPLGDQRCERVMVALGRTRGAADRARRCSRPTSPSTGKRPSRGPARGQGHQLRARQPAPREGRERWSAANAMPSFDSRDQAARSVAAARTITEQEEAGREQRRKISSPRTDRILRGRPHTPDPDGLHLDVNESRCADVGLRACRPPGHSSRTLHRA